MDYVIRSGRPDDLESIATWTQDTFEWGDYIAERYLDWLTDTNSAVLVCADKDDAVRALVHASMPSPTEGWMQGARVHPEFKRAGMGSALNHAGVEWAKARGARVIRLAIEADNPTAQIQVSKIGYRPGSTWTAGFTKPDPSFRAITGSGLRPSTPADVDSAWMFWSTSDLAGPARGMLCNGWVWRQARPRDLQAAAADGRLLQSQHGWVMIRPGSGDTQTMWMAAAAEDLPGLVNGLLDHAARTGSDHLVVKVPALSWSTETLRRAGFDVKGIQIYYKPA